MLKKAASRRWGYPCSFSFLHPEHEERIARRLEELGCASISHRILPEYREFERTSTVAINAYLQR